MWNRPQRVEKWPFWESLPANHLACPLKFSLTLNIKTKVVFSTHGFSVHALCPSWPVLFLLDSLALENDFICICGNL